MLESRGDDNGSVQYSVKRMVQYNVLVLYYVTYTPNAIVELPPHRHCVGLNLIAP